MQVLVSGGSASGKSEYAERMATGFCAPCIYLATMQIRDAEGVQRVRRHRDMRAGKGFETLECPLDLASAEIPPNSTVLMECLSNLVANECFDGAGFPGVEQRIIAGFEHLARSAEHLIVVTNELFGDGVRYDADTQRYLDVLARLNRWLAAGADQVFEVCCGIPIVWKETQR